MNSEEDEFNRIELEASLRKAAVKSAVGKHTIEMAREAAGDDWKLFQDFLPEIHKLAEFVRADEREETNRRANASWSLMCEKMVAAEREACAALVYNSPPSDEYESPLKAVYEAIRARGNT